ncbi:MAG: sugar phosphate isomerase/epimerase [Phototrophicales bacterium]|nr:MAG: sugar phosphate isomerase/epimerase [Phototrophicales bacterium]
MSCPYLSTKPQNFNVTFQSRYDDEQDRNMTEQLAPIALQLYSVREQLAQDFSATMQRIADIGFVGVESYAGLDAREVAAHCDALGLQVMGTHAPPPVGEDKQRVLDMVATLGTDIAIVPGLPHELFKAADGVEQACAILNEAAENAQAAGFRFGYHNHDREFVRIGNEYAYHLMRECLSDDVFLEVDTYWVETGGVNAIDLLKQLGSRAPLLHIKDGPANTTDPQVALGEGSVDVAGIVQANAAHVEWLVVELDECATDMLDAIAKSYAYLVSNHLGRGKA